MDRLRRVMAVGSAAMAFALVLHASGCRSMRSEVPPGKPYPPTGGQAPVGFSSDPHQNTGPGPGLYGSGSTPGTSGPDGNQSVAPSTGLPQFGTPPPNTGNYGAPTANKYGPVGSAPTGP
jgi:hypothetical protein